MVISDLDCSKEMSDNFFSNSVNDDRTRLSYRVRHASHATTRRTDQDAIGCR